MSGDSKRLSFFYAIPIPSPSLELHRFVVERVIQLGDSSGLAVFWRPIGPPSLADPFYKTLRTPELIARDEADEIEYKRLCAEAGSEELHLRRQYYNLTNDYGLSERDLPAVVFVCEPSCNEHAVLRLSPSAFASGETIRLLADFCHRELGKRRVSPFAFEGQYDRESLGQLREHLVGFEQQVSRNIARGEDVSVREWDSHLRGLGVEEWENPETCTEGRAWMKGLDLHFSAETNGRDDGETVFEYRDDGRNLQLMMVRMLLMRWPRPIKLKDLVRELHGDDYQRVMAMSKSGDFDQAAVELAVLAKRVKQMVADVRNMKLERKGINPEVLSVSTPSSGREVTVRIRLAKLDKRPLGHLPANRR